MVDWNAERYHEVSSPQQAWALKVLERLPLEGHERVLDLGCGSGRVTAEIARRIPRGGVVGVDRSEAMLSAASRWLGESGVRVPLARGDGAALPFNRAFDAVFSGATFHWIRDHAALFRSIVTALRPSGRLAAQCGGVGNLATLISRARRLMNERRFASYFHDWEEPANYADVESTKRRLAAAGFEAIDVWLEAAPTTFADAREYEQFIATVCVRLQLARLPMDERRAFVRQLTREAAEDSPPFTLDYCRLNIAARRPA
jgi:trans-aconitate 2-methyltransferase